MKLIDRLLLGLSISLSAVPSLAQNALQYPEIVEGATHAFVPTDRSPKVASLKGAKQMGVQTMYCGAYHDSLARYFDKIEEYDSLSSDSSYCKFFRAIFGGDTLSYKQRKDIIISNRIDKKILEVESKKAPYQRFEAEVTGLADSQIAALIDSMRQMKTTDNLMNNEQTCIFYALNLLFDSKGINPLPIISRNTTFTNGNQLNSFFNHILNLCAEYPCKYSVIKKVELPDDCVLVFQNAYKQFIHAVFYRKNAGQYYTKNGFWPPIILDSFLPVSELYGRYDTKTKLSKEGKNSQADTILVYCVK